MSIPKLMLLVRTSAATPGLAETKDASKGWEVHERVYPSGKPDRALTATSRCWRRLKGQTPKTNLQSYARNHERIARASFTVADWRRRRFDAVYPDYDVEVLFGDGRPASPRTLLLKVRASYD